MVCEDIKEPLDNMNVILIDELVVSGETMLTTYNYLKNTKKVNNIYPATIMISPVYNKSLNIDYVIKDGYTVILPWGYDN